MVSQIMEKMITFSNGYIHDIDHLIRVWTYSKTIGEQEGEVKVRNFLAYTGLSEEQIN